MTYNAMDGKANAAKDPIGYDPIDFPSRTDRPPMQHSGWAPEQVNQIDPQNAKFGSDAPILAPSSPMDGTPIAPVSGPADGAGSIGSDVPGWHPGTNGG